MFRLKVILEGAPVSSSSRLVNKNAQSLTINRVYSQVIKASYRPLYMTHVKLKSSVNPDDNKILYICSGIKLCPSFPLPSVETFCRLECFSTNCSERTLHKCTSFIP